jgi:hypothetical protein
MPFFSNKPMSKKRYSFLLMVALRMNSDFFIVPPL